MKQRKRTTRPPVVAPQRSSTKGAARPTSPGAGTVKAPERSVVGVNVRLQPQPTTVPVATGHGLSFWAVVVIALAMIVLVGASGHWSAGFWIALLVLVLVGALVPTAAIVFGGAALLYLALTHGQALIANVSALVSPPAQASQGGHP